MDLKVFVDTDSDERLSRRLIRDICLRGRALSDIIHQYDFTVKPAYDTYIAPTMSVADIIIPRGESSHFYKPAAFSDPLFCTLTSLDLSAKGRWWWCFVVWHSSVSLWSDSNQVQTICQIISVFSLGICGSLAK